MSIFRKNVDHATSEVTDPKPIIDSYIQAQRKANEIDAGILREEQHLKQQLESKPLMLGYIASKKKDLEESGEKQTESYTALEKDGKKLDALGITKEAIRERRKELILDLLLSIEKLCERLDLNSRSGLFNDIYNSFNDKFRELGHLMGENKLTNGILDQINFAFQDIWGGKKIEGVNKLRSSLNEIRNLIQRDLIP